MPPKAATAGLRHRGSYGPLCDKVHCSKLARYSITSSAHRTLTCRVKSRLQLHERACLPRLEQLQVPKHRSESEDTDVGLIPLPSATRRIPA